MTHLRRRRRDSVPSSTSCRALRGGRQRLIGMKSRVGFEPGFDGDLNARFIERNDMALAFADGKSLALKRIQLRQPKLAVELFVQHVNDLNLRMPAALISGGILS